MLIRENRWSAYMKEKKSEYDNKNDVKLSVMDNETKVAALI